MDGAHRGECRELLQHLEPANIPCVQDQLGPPKERYQLRIEQAVGIGHDPDAKGLIFSVFRTPVSPSRPPESDS